MLTTTYYFNEVINISIFKLKKKTLRLRNLKELAWDNQGCSITESEHFKIIKIFSNNFLVV